MYATIPSSRAALSGSVLPILRSTLCIFANRLVLNLRGTVDQAQSALDGADFTGGATLSFQRQRRRSRKLSKASARNLRLNQRTSDLPPFELTPVMREVIEMQDLGRGSSASVSVV